MKKPVTHVTDHALVRYLERVMGFDVDGLRHKIGHKVERGIEEGAGGVIIDGFCYKLRGRTVTTIAPSHQPNIRTDRSRRKAKTRS